MKLCLSLLAFVLLISGNLQAQTLDETTILQTVRNYLTSWHTGDPALMATVLHPEMIKRKPLPIDTAGHIRLEEVDQAAMTAAAGSGLGRQSAANGQSPRLRLMDQGAHMALVLLETPDHRDYVWLVKDGEQWQIANILWESTLQ